MFKFFIPCALLAVANAGLLPQIVQPALHTQVVHHGNLLAHAAPVAIAHAQPIAVAHAQPIAVAHAQQVEDYDHHPQYSYAYDIQDGLTGDSKNQQETRDGDVVRGSYSLVDPDGHKRTVEYTADPVNGFNAVVSREPLVAKAVVAHAQPVVAHHSHY